MWPIIMKDKVKTGDLKFPYLVPFPLREMFGATGTASVQQRVRSGIYFSTQSTDRPTCHRPLMIMFNHINSCIWSPASLILTFFVLGFFAENDGAMISSKSQQL